MLEENAYLQALLTPWNPFSENTETNKGVGYSVWVTETIFPECFSSSRIGLQLNYNLNFLYYSTSIWTQSTSFQNERSIHSGTDLA